METAKLFYGETLGLPSRGASHGAAIFDVGGQDLRLSPVPATNPSDHTVLGFAVSSLADATAALRSRGVSFERFAQLPLDEKGVLTTPEGARVAWFRDPDGNLLSLVEYKSEERLLEPT
jgi:catechol 2,3-dioxygenase-like lactoylglutathione lyase family enzyme